MTLRTPARDTLLLLARLGVGIVFLAHGWQKLATNGIAGTAAFFDQVGVPAPTASAWLSALVELLGGAALALGVALPIAGVLLAADMLGAYLFVHAGNGVFVSQNGFELVLALGAAALVLVAVGPGRFSVDDLLRARRVGPAETARP